MANIHLFIGSMLGGSEYVADALADALSEQGHQCDCHQDFDPMPVQPSEDSIWLIVTSTHGAGELPDNIQPLDLWLQQAPALTKQRFAVVAIGDSSYDTFCAAGHTLAQSLKNKNAVQLTETFEIDVQQDDLPEDVALLWIKQISPLFTGRS